MVKKHMDTVICAMKLDHQQIFALDFEEDAPTDDRETVCDAQQSLNTEQKKPDQTD